jgi:serine/threonine protein phosphatase PrpC
VQVISPVPQIEQYRLESSWDFLVVATDGVWDAMSNAEVLKYIRSRLENKNRWALSLEFMYFCKNIFPMFDKSLVATL